MVGNTKPPSTWQQTLPDADRKCDPLASLVLMPDRDIAGRGVIASFIGSGVLALVIVTIYYVLVFDPKVAQFPDRTRNFRKRQSSLSTRDTARWAAADYTPPNPVDEHMFELQTRFWSTIKWRPNWFPGKARIEECFRRCILGLSDLQILTGLCVLVAGFSSLETIPAFYWQIIVYVAWFSNLTHQCGLVFLRRYFHRKPWERGWRVLLITCLMILLVIATIPTMYFNWRDDGLIALLAMPASAAQPGTPVKCFYNHRTRSFMHEKIFGHPNVLIKFAGTRAFQNTLISLVFLMTSYITRMIKVFNTSSTFAREQIRGRLGKHLALSIAWSLRRFDQITGHTVGTEPWFLLVESPLVAVYLFFRLSLDVYGSVLSDVCWLYAGTMIGLWRLIAEKKSEAKYVDDTEGFEEEDRLMDFGQLLPLMLLASPLFSILGTFSHRLISDAAEPSARIRGLHEFQEGERESTNQHARQISHDYLQRELRKPIPPLGNLGDRWKRIHHLLEEPYWESAWFAPSLLTSFVGGFAVFLVIYINLVVAHGERTIFFQGLTAYAIITPLSVLPVQIGVATRGWQRKAAQRLCWLCAMLIVGTHIWVCFRFAITIDYITLSVTLSVSVAGYFLVCLIVCLLPRSWTWGRPVLQETGNVSAGFEGEEVLPAPSSASRTTTASDVII